MSKLRTLWLFGVASLVLGVAGCGGGDDDDAGAFGPEWILYYLDDTRADCDQAGTPTVDLDLRTAGGQDLHFMFPCKAGAGQTQALPAGDYSAALRLKDSKNRIVSELADIATLFSGGVTRLPAAFYVQSFKLQWSITKGGNIASCDTVGASHLQFEYWVGEMKEVQMYPCAPRVAASPAIQVDTLYSYQVRLVDAAGKLIPGAQTVAKTIPVDAKSRPVITAEFALP